MLENNLVRGAAQKEVTVEWTEGRPVAFRLEYERGDGEGVAELLWLPPGGQKIDPARFLARAKEGTTLILAGSAEDWMPAVKEASGIDYRGSFKIGTVWLGGQYFVRDHPLFHGLPVNVALNWPYQAVVDDHRLGFQIDGEELVAGCWQSTGCQLGTAVGVIPYGKGRIVFSTLNIVPQASHEGLRKPRRAQAARQLHRLRAFLQQTVKVPFALFLFLVPLAHCAEPTESAPPPFRDPDRPVDQRSRT